MEADITPSTSSIPSIIGKQSILPVLVFVIGVSLWAQLFLLSFGAELEFADRRVWTTLAYALPLIVIVAALALRASLLLLLAFPLSLLPGLVLMPEPDQAVINELWPLLRICATFAIYLALSAALRSGSTDVPITSVSPREKAAAVVATLDYRWFFGTRIGIALFSLALITYAIFFDDHTLALLQTHYAGGEDVARSFLAIFMFFAWCVFVYVMVFVPSMNLEYDQRKLSGSLDAMRAKISRPAAMMRIGGWVTVCGLAVFVVWTMGGQ